MLGSEMEDQAMVRVTQKFSSGLHRLENARLTLDS